MQRTNIYLGEDQLRLLRHLAAEEERTVAGLVRQAVDNYLAQRLDADAEWRSRLDAVVARIRERVPQGATTPDEIESDISAARSEVKRAKRVARGR